MPVGNEALEVAVVGSLAAITVAGGYSCDAGRNVFRVEALYEKIGPDRFPALFMVEDSEGETFEHMQTDQYRSTVDYVVAGATTLGSLDLLDPRRATQLNGLIRDVERVLLADPTFGRAVKNSWILRRTKYLDPERDLGVFNLKVRLFYHLDGGSL